MKLLWMKALALTCLFIDAGAHAEESHSFEGWYQVDIILFKPRNVNLDEESWPDLAPRYPADVISISEPHPFRLSLLEQALAGTELQQSETEEEGAALRRDEFRFIRDSRRQFNRRVIDAVTGSETSPELADDLPADPDPDSVVMQDLASINLNADPNSPGQLAFSRVEDRSRLDEVLRSLNRSSRYDVLGHNAWIQPIGAEATPVMFQAGKRYDDRFELEGTLSFSRSRFLHVQTNLWYTVFEPRGGAANPYLTGFESSLPDPVLAEYPELVEVERERGQYYAARTHSMVQSRRMRSEEIHYLDHPLFGVIVRVTRFQ